MIKKDELIKKVIVDLQNKVVEYEGLLEKEKRKIQVKEIIAAKVSSRNKDDFDIIKELTPESIIEYFHTLNYIFYADVNDLKEALYFLESGKKIEKFKLTEEYEEGLNRLIQTNHLLFRIANHFFIDSNVIFELEDIVNNIKTLILFLENKEVDLVINDISEIEYLEKIFEDKFNEEEYYEIYKIIVSKYVLKILNSRSQQSLIEDINVDLEPETNEVENIIEETITVDNLLIDEINDNDLELFQLDESRVKRFEKVKEFFEQYSDYIENLIDSKKNSFDRILNYYASNSDIELLKSSVYEKDLIVLYIYAIYDRIINLSSFFEEKHSKDELDLICYLVDEELDFCELFISFVKDIEKEKENTDDVDIDLGVNNNNNNNNENYSQKVLILYQNEDGKSKIEREFKHLPREHSVSLISIFESIKNGSLGKSIPIGNYIKFQYIIRESVVVIFKTLDDNHVLIYDISSPDNLSESVYLDKLGNFDKKYLKNIYRIIRDNGLEYRRLINSSEEVLKEINESIVSGKGAKL